MGQIFDTIVVITPKDFIRLRSNYPRLIRWLPNGRAIFIGNKEVGELVRELSEELDIGSTKVVNAASATGNEPAASVTGEYGNRFYEKIINCIPLEDIQGNGFSEFETYGSFVCLTSPQTYKLREWYSFRLAGEFFDPETISDDDYEWLSHDFDAVSFEKGMTVREDHKNLFDNKEYQSKLSARQMLKIAQEEFKDGYIEKL